MKWFLLLALAGCASKSTSAKTAQDLAIYNAQLDQCFDAAKKVNSYAVYEQCADEVDRQHGRVKK